MNGRSLREQLTFRNTLLGVQFLFVAFGATVLVPLLVGIDPAVALFTAGIGTLIFHFITKGQVPVFLGSSFAFIAPIIEATKLYGWPGTLSGIIAVGLVYGIVSALIKLRGIKFIERLFPSVVVGPIILLIGLSLASVAVDMAKTDWKVAIITLTAAVVVVIFGRKMIKLIPIFIAIGVGYTTAFIFGKLGWSVPIDLAPVKNAAWFDLPQFTAPQFSWQAILYMIPVAIAPIIEHVGDMYAISGVCDKNFIEKPGLHRTLLGDGIASGLAGFFGGVPNTTYSEVTGAITLTKVTNPFILRISAITAIVFAFVGKISGVLETIPQSVLGGIMLLLFGMIASIGIKTMVDSRTCMSETRNQVITSLVLTIGIGGAVIKYGTFSLAGIGLAATVGIILNLLLPATPKKDVE